MVTSYEYLGKVITNEIIEPIRETAIARQLMKVNTSYVADVSTDSVQAYKFSDLSDALIMRALPDESIFRDGIRSETHTVLLNSIVEGFDIKKQEYDNFEAQGIPIQSSLAMIAAEKVAERENEMILTGWTPDGTNYEIEGMQNLTGCSTESTSYDFGTYGNAVKKVTAAKNVLNKAGVMAGAFNLTLNQTQYAQLEASLSTTGTEEMEQVIKRLNPNGGTAGRVRVHSDVSENYGLLTPVDPIGKYFELIQTYAPTAEINPDPKMGSVSPLYGHVLERVGLNFKYPAAVCKLSGI